jgi:hypothetical protein
MSSYLQNIYPENRLRYLRTGEQREPCAQSLPQPNSLQKMPPCWWGHATGPPTNMFGQAISQKIWGLSHSQSIDIYWGGGNPMCPRGLHKCGIKHLHFGAFISKVCHRKVHVFLALWWMKSTITSIVQPWRNYEIVLDVCM